MPEAAVRRTASAVQDLNEFSHGVGAAVEVGQFFLLEVQLYYLFDA